VEELVDEPPDAGLLPDEPLEEPPDEPLDDPPGLEPVDPELFDVESLLDFSLPTLGSLLSPVDPLEPEPLEAFFLVSRLSVR